MDKNFNIEKEEVRIKSNIFLLRQNKFCFKIKT